MRVVRLLGCLSALLLVLALGWCGASPSSESRASVEIVRTSVAVTPALSPKGTLVTVTPTAAVKPARLLIPAIGVNASIESLGILTTGYLAGDLATPTRSPWEDVGWYNGGPRPGERGSAVIDGHLDRTGGGPAVFWYLRDLHVGDSVLVVNTNGKILRFHVTRIASYPPQAAPLQDIFGNNGGIYLNLITCAGDWIPSLGQTTLRLVVYTALG